MESQRAKRNRRNQFDSEDTGPELTKEEAKVLRHLRLNCPFKQGSLQGMKVDFFIANRLIDFLMESKWGPDKSNVLFSSRQACVNFMQRLMNKQMLYRAVKIYKDQQPKSDKDGDKSDQSNTPSVRKRNKAAATAATGSTSSGGDVTPAPTPKSGSGTPKNEQNQNVKRKFKLDVHEDQKFLDTNEPYVWVYETASTKTYIIGALLILGAIAICCFPLWPSQVREGVYYLSLAAASFLGAILGLAVLKYIIYAAVYIVTVGKVKFWLFPNLTEDVGFVESFIPVYKCTCAQTNSENENVQTKNETTTTTTTTENDAPADKNVKIVTSDLSKSTVDINTVKIDTPKARKKSTAIEDDYEMLNDEELPNETN